MAINQDEKLNSTIPETPAQEGLRLADERAAAAQNKAAKAGIEPTAKPTKEKAPKAEKPAKALKVEKAPKAEVEQPAREKAPKPAAVPIEAKPVSSDKAVAAVVKAHAAEIKVMAKDHATEVSRLVKRITELKKAVDLETATCIKELAKKDKQHEAQLVRVGKDAKASLKVATDEAYNAGQKAGEATGYCAGRSSAFKSAIAAVKAL